MCTSEVKIRWFGGFTTRRRLNVAQSRNEIGEKRKNAFDSGVRLVYTLVRHDRLDPAARFLLQRDLNFQYRSNK